ncbi:hypothetical protein H1Z61_16690 [Bacillus aquiflavi]|uniref:Uncharacterized protein n=1 Tax=Bacillus aquiflavi TaxID=2672567 RepID=A0A6B3W0P8_9BACI|nr:hypothetical protein [Bacillus aquiflavi]MBA4538718.1 hypothetical protein [Bacillus aquiflavi]NEY83078.1 hypothetical protein [Bacillus aquiflavi]UAC48393.1 hypothetical protein K6959_18175 [Bacillus aquiflavi]
MGCILSIFDVIIALILFGLSLYFGALTLIEAFTLGDQGALVNVFMYFGLWLVINYILGFLFDKRWKEVDGGDSWILDLLLHFTVFIYIAINWIVRKIFRINREQKSN